MSGIEGKVVMVTGGSNGIGAAAVRQFLHESAKYVAILDVDDAAGTSLQNELTKEYGSKAKFIKCDVTSGDELAAAYKEVLEDNGRIDIVINNAGIADESDDMYEKAININFTATVTGTLKAIEAMHKDHTGRGGVVINISSITALMQHPYAPIYYATKSAVLQFSNCIGAQENFDKTGVKVMTICFGATDTGIFSEKAVQSYNRYKSESFNGFLETYYRQSPKSAATSLVEICKRGESGTTWLMRDDLPVEDITPKIKEAYDLLTALLSGSIK